MRMADQRDEAAPILRIVGAMRMKSARAFTLIELLVVSATTIWTRARSTRTSSS